MATKPGSRQLSWLPNNLFDTGGMPAWLATAFDTDERRSEFTKWMGDMFDKWSGGQSVTNAANSAALEINKRRSASALGTGKYLSQRQLDDIYHPESNADKLARIQFKGGMVNGRYVTNYDEWKAAGDKQHTGADGQSLDRKWTPDKSATARFKETFAGQHWKEGADAWVARSGDAAGGDYRSVRLNRDGTQTFTFGKENSTYNKALRNQRVGDTSGEWMFDSPEPQERRMRSPGWIEGPASAAKDWVKGLFAASKGGEAMRERGWLDAIFNGGLTRAALRGGRTRK